jgi:hypothetical protein
MGVEPISAFPANIRESTSTDNRLEQGGRDSDINVGQTERWVSALAGGALAIYGLTRRSRGGVALALAGGALAHRGITGHCYISDALGVNRSPIRKTLGAASFEISPVDALKAIAETLVGISGIPGPIGALFIGVVFPPGPPFDIQAFYASIKGIVHEEIQINVINLIRSDIQQVIDDLRDTYPTKKANPDNTKKDLYAYIQTVEPIMNSVVSKFVANWEWAKAAYPVYLLAVNLHLLLLQELAIVDPKTDDPWKSDHIGDIKKRAGDHADEGKNIWQAMETDRLKKIHIETQNTDGGPIYRWVDDLTTEQGEWIDTWGSLVGPGLSDAEAQKKVGDECQAHRSAAILTLEIENGGYPYPVIDNTWLVLKNTALPPGVPHVSASA